MDSPFDCLLSPLKSKWVWRSLLFHECRLFFKKKELISCFLEYWRLARFTRKIMNKSKIWQISEQLLTLPKIKVLLLIILYVNIDAKGSIPNSVHCVSLVKAFCIRKSGLSLEIIHFKTKTINFFFLFTRWHSLLARCFYLEHSKVYRYIERL